MRISKIWWIGLVYLILHVVIAFFLPNFLPFLGFFPYRELAEASGLPDYLLGFANFDGVHYMSIASQGYTTYEEAFFPIYPMLIRVSGWMIQNYLLAGWVMSWMSFVGALLVLQAYLKGLDLQNQQRQWFTAFLLAYPTAFFFISLYTESIFMLFILLCLWFAQQRKFVLSALFAYLAGLTRLTGVFLIFPLGIIVLSYVFEKNRRLFTHRKYLTISGEYVKLIFSHTKLFLLITAPILGLSTYCWYLWQTTGDPLFFFHAQPAFGANRSTDLILFPQVMYRYMKIFIAPFIVAGGQFNFQYAIAILEFITFNVTLLLLGIEGWKIWSKRIPAQQVWHRLGLLTFSLVNLLVPSLTGTFSSIPRYALLCLTIFFVLSDIRSRRFKIIILVVSVVLHVVLFSYFFQGYFIS